MVVITAERMSTKRKTLYDLEEDMRAFHGVKFKPLKDDAGRHQLFAEKILIASHHLLHQQPTIYLRPFG
jgi:hypothetical protein